MDVRSPFFQNIALILAGVMFLNPIVATAAQLVVDAQAGGNTSIGQAGNGVPIVNIATPNGSGLSHNRFTDYNVGQQGLILNNATERLQGTQLGGLIIGNANLHGRAAGVILNEVTGSSRSQLKGYTEVAGQSARVIVANPHGITCDGCGFINTPRATLSTGAPVIEDGRLKGFDVEGGDIAIEGMGVNASNLDQFDLITRSAQINAEIHAKRLNVITGRNEVDATTLQATAKADDGSDKPQIAIDSSALGGMYAGAIRLLGTEAGVGVKLAGDMAASAGDIQIDAAGQLTLGRTAAQHDLRIAAGSAELAGPAYAGNNAAIRATAALSNEQSLAAANRIDLQAGRLDNTGIIEAGVEADNSRNASGDVRVGATDVRNAGQVLASRELRVDAERVLDNTAGELHSAGDATVVSSDLANQSGRITANGDLKLQGGRIDNSQGRITASQNLGIRAVQLTQERGVLGSGAQLSLDLAGGNLDNRAGSINAGQGLQIDNVAHVDNARGEISSRQGFELHAGSLGNSAGKLVSEQSLRIGLSEGLDNRGGSLAGRQVQIAAGALDNGADGALRSEGPLDIDVRGTLTNRDGELFSGTDLVLRAAELNNSEGLVASRGSLKAEVGQLTQASGKLLAEGDLSLTGQRLDNRDGRVAANGQLSMMLDAIDNRGGEIGSLGTAELHAAELDNSDKGRLLAVHLNLVVSRLLNRAQGLILGRDQVRLLGAYLDNSAGTFASDAQVLIELAAHADDSSRDGQLINDTGTISSEGALNILAAKLDNDDGVVSSAGPLQVTSQGVLHNQRGRLATDAGLLLRSAGLLNQQGEISAKEHLSAITGRFDNQGGRLTGNAGLDLQAERIGNAEGRIAASGPVSVQAGGLMQQGGELFSQTALTLDLGGGDLNNDAGLLHAPDRLLLQNLGAVSNRGGEVSSGQGFNLTATSLDNADGRLLSEQNLTLRIQNVLSNLSGLISARGIDLRANDLSNDAGSLHAAGNLGIDLAGSLSNTSKGVLQGAGDVRLNSGTLNNSGGTLLAGRNLELRNVGAVDNREGGLINSQGTLTLDAASLDSSQQGEVSAKGDVQLALGHLAQQQGRLIAEGALALDLRQGDLDNHQGLMRSTGPLTLRNLRAFDNTAGEVSSLGVLELAAASLDNRNARLISQEWLRLSVGQADNRGGLLSGWQGLQLSGSSLDNRQQGTLSSRDGNLDVQLSGALLNSGEGAVVAAIRLDVRADSLDNSDKGILSSGAGQRLLVTRLLGNRAGQIDAGESLVIDANRVTNVDGLLQAQQNLSLTSETLDNGRGRIAASGAATLSVDRTLNNAAGQLASAGPLSIATDILSNQVGTLASQSTAKLVVSELDNSGGATLAANGALAIEATQALNNSADGLIYSRDALVSLNADSLDNSGGAIQGQGDLLLKIGAALNNHGGVLQSRAGAVDLTAASLDNRQGTLASLEGWVRTRLSGWLRNGASDQGGLIQGQYIDLQAAGRLDNTAGRIHALSGAATLQATAFDNQSGSILAQGDLLLRGGDLNNQSGTLGAANIGLEHAGNAALSNQQGIIESRGTLHVQGGSLDNQGGQLRALGNEGTTFFTLGKLLDNRDGILETANRDLTFSVGSLLNQNGTLLHAGDGTFAVAMEQIANAGGRFVTQSGLSLKADSWRNDSILQAEHLTFDIGSFEQTANGQLLVTGSLTGKGDNWINHGLIASDGPLSLSLSGSYGGDGRLTSQGPLDLAATNVSLSEAAAITSASTANFVLGGALLNQGRVTAAENLTLDAASVNNTGTLGSAQRLTISAPGVVNDKGLLFSGDDMALYVDTVDNRYADVHSQGDLFLARDAVGGTASRLNNLSATLEASGRATLRVDVLNNARERLAFDSGIHSARIDERFCVQPGVDCRGKRSSWFEITQLDRLRVAETSPMSQIAAGGDLRIHGGVLNNRSSLISTGGDFSANVRSLDNSGIDQGEIRTTRMFRLVRMDGKYIVRHQNNARDFTRRYWHESAQYDPQHADEIAGAIHRIISDHDFEVELHDRGSRSVLSSGDQRYAGIIQAAGNLAIDAQERYGNGATRAAYTHVSSGLRSPSPSVGANDSFVSVSLNPQLPPDLAQQQVNPLSLPGFSLPSGQNGLFRLSGQGGSQVREGAVATQLAGARVEQAKPADVGDVTRTDQRGQPQLAPVQLSSGEEMPVATAPDTQVRPSSAQDLGVVVSAATRPHKYLIETNPALTELNHFLNSDYMLGQLGYDPDQAQKRLGDGLYEQRLIREAIMARTGQRYIAGLTSDEAMFRYLMDNAIASKDALSLGLGVSLSAEQVAALTHDIVWMEEQEVLGEKVLVPVLYLAQSEGRLVANGALIQGRDVTLIGGADLSNQGTLRASGTLGVQAQNIANSGLMQANERLQLLATDSIRNAQGGIIAGWDVGLTAREGDIVNELTTNLQHSGQGNRAWANSFVDSAARIEASESLHLNAGRDVSNQGSALRSRGDLTIQAGRDVNIASVQDVQHQSRGDWLLRERVTQLGAEVSAGRDLQISAGRDLGVVASQVTAQRDLELKAGRDMELSSAEHESHSFARTKKITQKNDRITQQASEIDAGRDLRVTAGNDLTLLASEVQSGDKAYFYAGEQLNLLAAQDSDYSLYDMKKKGSWGRKKTQRDEVTTVRNIGSTITSGGNLSLVSEGGQLYQRARLESGADLSLNSGGAITFEAVKDFDQKSHEKSKSSLAWNSAKGRGTTDETLQQTQISAQGAIAINAVQGLNIDLKQVDQLSVSQSIDAMVQADPNLAWLKAAEQRGDVDWRQVKEIHDRFKYNHSGLGVAAQMVIAIGMAAVVGPMAAGGAGGAATGAVASAAATNATVSAINNRGDLGAVFKDVTSSDALKGYAVTGITAGLTSGLLDEAFGVTGDNINKVTKGFDLSDLSDIGKFGTYLGAQGTVQAAAQTAVQGGSFSDNLQSALTNQAYHLIQAVGFKFAGDFAEGAKSEQLGNWANVNWPDGSAQKVALHAVMGGLLSEATGGDFATGALAAGANELLVEQLSKQIDGDKHLELAVSQLVGVAAASVTGGDLSKSAELAKNATAYNRQLHSAEAKLLDELAQRDPERARAWDAAACALISCASGVPPSDDNYEFLTALQAEGAQYPELQASLQESGLFGYSLGERFSDAASSRGKAIYYTGATGSVIVGAAGAVGSAIGGAGTCAASLGAGCALGAIGVAGSLSEYSDGVDRLSSGFSSTEGQKVIDSFRPGTHPGDVSLAEKAGDFAVSAAADVVLQRVGGGVIDRVAKAVDGKLNVPKTESDAAGDALKAIRGAGKPLVSKGSEVTSDIIQKALQGDPAISAQGAVSLPAVQRYVDRLLKGDVAPAIKMDGNVIVDGNHRYIAAKILGRNPEVTSGILPPNKAGQTKPVSELKVDEVDWGNK